MSASHETPDHRSTWLGLGTAFLLALIIAAWLLSTTRQPAPWEGAVELRTLPTMPATALAKRFDEAGHTWPPEGPVPALSVRTMPSDMGDLRAPERKALFFRIILPLAIAENRRIEAQRDFIRSALNNGRPAPESAEAARLAELAREYKVDPALPPSQLKRRLLHRADTLPPALILVQAANESGWGTSRFTQQANNLFGVWTYNPEEGIRPTRAGAGTTHSVRLYRDIQHSVRGYIHNINAGHAYADLRELRAQRRASGNGVTAHALAAGLERYSERGQEYIDELRSMMVNNDLRDMGLRRLALAD
ncbi:Bax protein [Thiohalospira halophila DSM 15071]|uniref:Bax protein n=1 Tax=Thiohalospira halophila DSM 15071 TaxID=1123397 RepID=A0A1I1QK52_9GAMM|nr:glucosaminidase domain-containing protein [Thiohalospira halophila]SFD19653.1 Bax protein [Thiohalospira halophila DSM 15071]